VKPRHHKRHEGGDALKRSESEVTTMESKLETQFVLRFVADKDSATWMLTEDPDNGIVWQIDIPFPGSGGVPWIVQKFPLSAHAAREIAEWLLSRVHQQPRQH
jgi:hypothetical protein